MKDRLGKLFMIIGIVLLIIPIGLNIYYKEKSKIAVKSFQTKTLEKREEKRDVEKESSKEERSDVKKEDPIGVLHIPSIREELPIYQDDVDKMEVNLDRGVVLLNRETMRQDPFRKSGPDTIRELANLLPEETENIVLTGHRGTLSTNQNIFKNLDQLEKGDVFYIDNGTNFLIYRIYDFEVIEPNEGDKIYKEHDKQQASLVTCTPYLINSHRLIYWGELEDILPNTNEQIRNALNENQKASLRLVNPVNLVIVVVLFTVLIGKMYQMVKNKRSLNKERSQVSGQEENI